MPSLTQNSELSHNLPVEPPGAAIANRYGRIMSRIDTDAGGAGLDSVIRVTERVALVSVEAVAGRARLDPRQSVPGGGRTRQLSFGKDWKNRKLH